MHLSVEEWRVVSFVNPKNSIRQIAKANNMSENEIRRIVYGLEQAGLVEIIKPPSAPGDGGKSQQGGGQRPASKAPPVQKSVVNRIIERIQKI